MFEKIIKSRKIKYILLGSVILFFVSSFDFVAFAENAKAGQDVNSKINDIESMVISVISFLLGIASFFLSFITYLATLFLSPEWINGTLFNINTYLKSLWILVSNIVYVIFAFILIGIAFMNIVGIGQDKFQLKQTLPKFILGILMVPFSWFIVQFVLSLSAILTVAAVNLPFDTFKGYSTAIGGVKIPKECTINFSASGGSGNKGKSSGKSDNAEEFFKCEEEKITVDQALNTGSSSDAIFGVLGTYTYGIVSIEGNDKISKDAIAHIKKISDVSVKVIFDIIFTIIYAILMIAIGLVLMIRGIYIWIYMIFSPIFGLMIFFDKKEGGESFFSKLNIKDFLSLALVPVYTMLALSFGMLFLFVIGQGITGTGEQNQASKNIKINTTKNEEAIMINSFTLKLKGAVSGKDNITGLLKEVGDTGLGIVGALILKVFGIVVLWGAVMAALQSNKITGAVVKPLADFGNKVGEIAKASPTYLPVFGGQSMQSMSKVAGQAQGVFDSKALNQSKEFTSKIPFFSQAEFVNGMQELTNAMKKSQDASEVRKVYERFRQLPNMTRDRFRDGMNQLNEVLKQSNPNLSSDKNYNTYNDAVKGLQEVNKKINNLTGKYIGGISMINDANAYDSNSTSPDDSPTVEAHQIKVGNQTINVQRNVATDGSKGKIIGLEKYDEDTYKNLLSLLNIIPSGNNDIGKTEDEFTALLVEQNFTQTLAEDIIQRMKGSYNFKSIPTSE